MFNDNLTGKLNVNNTIHCFQAGVIWLIFVSERELVWSLLSDWLGEQIKSWNVSVSATVCTLYSVLSRTNLDLRPHYLNNSNIEHLERRKHNIYLLYYSNKCCNKAGIRGALFLTTLRQSENGWDSQLKLNCQDK